MANGSGWFQTTVEADMGAFDRLPRPIRLALARLPENRAAEPILREWEEMQPVAGAERLRGMLSLIRELSD